MRARAGAADCFRWPESAVASVAAPNRVAEDESPEGWPDLFHSPPATKSFKLKEIIFVLTQKKLCTDCAKRLRHQ